MAALLPAGLALLWCGRASAYRPFDGTNASVADLDHIEVELGPVEYGRSTGQRMLLAPDLTLNYGFAPGWEAVLEGQTTHGVSLTGARISQSGDEFSLKTVLRDGVLQDQSGSSVATELGVLLPGIDADHGTGASLAGIVSQRWGPITLHLNGEAALTRQQHADLFASTIIEGPFDWPVRPVSEIAYERDFGGVETKSTLIGALWQVREDIAVDAGLRASRFGGHTGEVIRVGVTFAFATK